MHKRELSPQDEGEFVYFDANFGEELKKAETGEYCKSDLELICDTLNIRHDVAIAEGYTIMVDGISYTKLPNGEVSEDPDQALGTFMGWGTVLVHGLNYLTVKVGNDKLSERELVEFYVTEQPGFEWSIHIEDPFQVDQAYISMWQELAFDSFDLQEFLTRAAARLTRQEYDKEMSEMISALERVLEREYNLYPGTAMQVDGCNTLISWQGHGSLDPHQLPRRQFGMTGTFEGLTVAERIEHGCKVARLCLALTNGVKGDRLGGIFALQPCGDTHKAEIL